MKDGSECYKTSVPDDEADCLVLKGNAPVGRAATKWRQESSPRREPWVRGETDASPEGAKESGILSLLRSLRITVRSDPRLTPWATLLSLLRSLIGRMLNIGRRRHAFVRAPAENGNSVN